MKENLKRNSGFTLVELIVAMAILAFIMTAVGTVMSSSMVHNRKANADITVQTSAQQTYNQLSDSVMQATDIILLGYTAPADLDFSEDEATVGNVNNLTYYVRDEAARDAFIANYNVAYAPRSGDPAPTTANVKYFTDLNPDDKVYVVRLYVDTAEELDMSKCSSTLMGSYYYVVDFFDYQYVEVKAETTVSGDYTWDTKDTLRNIYTFDDGGMYYERTYRFNNSSDYNDLITNWGDANSRKTCLYNGGFTVVYSGGDASSGTPITGCVATVDAANGSIGFDLYFSDKNMTYTTLGMINTRNSFVLKGKKM